MDKVRFGIVGMGNMGSGHANGFFENKVKDGVLTAICDVAQERMGWAAEKDPSLKRFDNAEAMFASGEVDAVVIATPHYDHPPLTESALAHGLHVMSEKPAGVYTKQVRQMNEVAAQSDRVFGIMYQMRTDSVFKKMREMVQGGKLGEIKRTSWIITNWYRSQVYYDSGTWRATWKGEGGGVLLNQCPHNLDLWQWICGMPSRVTAFCHEGKWHSIEVEDDVTAYVEYENGATGTFITTTADAPGTNRFEIVGDLGKLVYEDGKLTFYRLDMSEREFNRTNAKAFGSPGYTIETIETMETDGSHFGHTGVLSAFVDKILGRGELVACGCEGINGLTISNAMHLSSWTKKTIELPLDEDLYWAQLQKKFRCYSKSGSA